MHRVVLTAAIRPGHEDEIRRLLEEGPPFDLGSTSFERHEIFIAEGRIVFLFEGIHAERELERLLHDPATLGAAGGLAEHLDELPVVAAEAFSWERPTETEGLSWGAQPGPGDSEGGG